MTDNLASLLNRTLLLDFDGPVCSVFAGMPAQGVATYLRQLAMNLGYEVGDLKPTTGPIEILHWAELQSYELTVTMEEALGRVERTAVRSATMTDDATDVIHTAKREGRAVAIVSNNSPGAIQEYLALHGLIDEIDVIVGRPWARPADMKPSPAPIAEAARELGVPTEACVLVGDATTDIEAAHAAGAVAIGFANKPGKASQLKNAGADQVVNNMSEIVSALTVVRQT